MYLKIALFIVCMDRVILWLRGDYLAPTTHSSFNYKNYLKCCLRNVIIIIQRESTHSKGGCSEFRRIIVLTDDAYPVDQTG